MTWPLGLYRVSGHSMEPTYKEGDMLLGLRWFKLRPGDVVVAKTDRLVVKRLGADRLSLVSDKPGHPPIRSANRVLAKVVAKLT